MVLDDSCCPNHHQLQHHQPSGSLTMKATSFAEINEYVQFAIFFVTYDMSTIAKVHLKSWLPKEYKIAWRLQWRGYQ